MQRVDGRCQIFLCALSRALRASKYPIGAPHLADTYAIFISAGLDFSMHSMDEKWSTPEIHAAGLQTNPTPPTVTLPPRARKTKATPNANHPTPIPGDV